MIIILEAGVNARSGTGIVVVDLDGDGDERTGWNIFYLHVATDRSVEAGSLVNAGDSIGHPSCEGKSVQANGTHIHIARKYNGEWVPADGTLVSIWMVGSLTMDQNNIWVHLPRAVKQ